MGEREWTERQSGRQAGRQADREGEEGREWRSILPHIVLTGCVNIDRPCKAPQLPDYPAPRTLASRPPPRAAPSVSLRLRAF
ncbi:hypothetical protein E2C01_046931 [Portunus trituberculatus]|uniref:Uncharacterized protein n=1 Tax=Portunus trituberculatus TaxID=210409 RepID=A0A5B7G680_PORTR|nr:hypothetical protein [Portunus trituberculatus]